MMTLRAHFVTACFACVVVLFATWGYDKAASAWNAPETFMRVSVTVPEHRQGEDPTVVYSREIFREMRGVWTVEIRNLDQAGEQCHGTGAAIYSPRERSSLPLRLSAYIGVSCDLAPGRYIMATRWDLTDTNGNSAAVLDVTEPFTVLPN